MNLTIKQAAARLNISTKTVFRLIASGEIPVMRDGVRIVRIAESDLQEYINNHKA